MLSPLIAELITDLLLGEGECQLGSHGRCKTHLWDSELGIKCPYSRAKEILELNSELNKCGNSTHYFVVGPTGKIIYCTRCGEVKSL